MAQPFGEVLVIQLHAQTSGKDNDLQAVIRNGRMTLHEVENGFANERLAMAGVVLEFEECIFENSTM